MNNTYLKYKDYIPLAALGVSGASLGYAASNYKLNKQRFKESTEYQKQQLRAMEGLTRSLNKVDKTFERMPNQQWYGNPQPKPIQEEPKKKFLFFSQKNHSRVGDYAWNGALIGGTLMGGAIPFIPDSKFETSSTTKENKGTGKKFVEKGSKKSMNPFVKKALLELGGIAVGAGLGALAGCIMDETDRRNRKATVNNRLMGDICDNLRRIGFIEGRDFVRDPKRASLMKTKICMVISRSSDDLKLVINTVNDYKLKQVTEQITKNLPTMSTLTEKASDRYNELNITTLASNSGDATWIASIAEKFIKSGFPVYLVEVG